MSSGKISFSSPLSSEGTSQHICDDELFNIALLADIGTCSRFSQLLSPTRFDGSVPRIHVAAILSAPEMEELPPDLSFEEWGDPPPRYTSNFQDLLAQCPELNMLLVFVDDEARLRELRMQAPPSVTVADRLSSEFLLRRLEEERAGLSCESDLHYTRTLFQTIFEEVEEDIILLDVKGNIVDTNRNVYERKGVTREQVKGLSCADLEGGEFCCKKRDGDCPYRKTLASGKKAEQIHSYVDDTGRMRYFRVYTYPVFDTNRTLTYILELRRDITNRTNMELRLQQSEKMAAIGELATYIAHEIRNPLFAIGGFANSLLRAPSLDETAREKVSIILQESKRLDNILKSILNFARPTDPREGMVDINRVAAETSELMAIGATSKGISIDLELDRRVAMVKGDGEMIKQCLINMIKNAVEAMPEGGVISLRTGLRGTYVTLEIADNGPGIPRELREKVFNPFFSTKEKGAGLGLPMTKKIIEEMGGKIELHTRSGQGTRFVIHLPPVLAVDHIEMPLGDE